MNLLCIETLSFNYVYMKMSYSNGNNPQIFGHLLFPLLLVWRICFLAAEFPLEIFKRQCNLEFQIISGFIEVCIKWLISWNVPTLGIIFERDSCPYFLTVHQDYCHHLKPWDRPKSTNVEAEDPQLCPLPITDSVLSRT